MKLSKFVEMHNLTATVLAEATGLTKPTIMSYIEERRMPSVDNAFKIERATLGIVKATDFIEGNKSTKKKRATS